MFCEDFDLEDSIEFRVAAQIRSSLKERDGSN